MAFELKDNSILILSDNVKNSVIKEIRSNGVLLDIKFMTMSLFISKYYFDYDNRAIYYLMKKYNWKEEVALVYLKNLYYIDDREYSFEKLNFLKSLKKELIDHELLIFDEVFRKNLSKKNIYVYGFSSLKKFDRLMLEEISKTSSVEFINNIKKEYKHEVVYKFKSLEEEVNFVAIKICNLLRQGIDINKIKLANVNNEYTNTLIKIFSFYHIPIYLNRSISLYSSSMGKYFLNNLNSDISYTLDIFKNKFGDSNEVYNLIIDILNNYTWCNDYLDIKDMLIFDFKNKYIKEEKLAKQVECIEIRDNIISDDYYVFLMNFNQGNIPSIVMDEGYITDNMISEVDKLETTYEINMGSRSSIIKDIKAIKNLFISYKEESFNGNYIISNLCEDLNLKIVDDFEDSLLYSNLYNKLRLSSYLDVFIKYGSINDRLGLLYNNYKNILYASYDNSFKGIDIDDLRKFLNNKLLLSYSTIDNYYRCGFRYYLNNILKLSIYEDTFMTNLGSLFHFILSKALNDDKFDVDLEYDKFIKDSSREYDVKERFFLKKLKGEIKFIIDSIKKQMLHCELGKSMMEQEIYVDKSRNIRITFMGIVDKIIYDNIDDKCILSIIDYKTGNPQININNTIYGIEMQLPVYLYLVRNSDKFSNVYVAGFYLQKILNNEILKDGVHSYDELKQNNLKLQGYSNGDINILSFFDSSYNDSNVVKGLKTSSKGFYSYSKVLDNEKINKLVDIVDDKIDEAIDGITSAKFDINPKKIGKVNYGCEFCKFRDICFMSEKDIVNLKEYKNLEFLEVGGDNNDTN